MYGLKGGYSISARSGRCVCCGDGDGDGEEGEEREEEEEEEEEKPYPSCYAHMFQKPTAVEIDGSFLNALNRQTDSPVEHLIIDLA